MYLENLHVRRLKLLRDFELGFRRADGSLRYWTVIIGKNGTAKTSLLQAAALTATGSLQLNRVARPVIGHLRDRRQGNAQLNIEARFAFSERGLTQSGVHPLVQGPPSESTRLKSVVRMGGDKALRGSSTYEGCEARISPGDPLDEARAKNLPRWFVSGYGIHRFLKDPSRSASQLEQPSIERLESLFGPEITLTPLRFLDHFTREKARRFAKTVRDTLTRAADLVPDLVGVELRGSGGVSKAALSHGYQSTVAWIADLIGHREPSLCSSGLEKTALMSCPMMSCWLRHHVSMANP